MNTPWHLWLVGILAVLWNGFGCVDYTLTKLDVTAYTASMPEGMREYLAAYPVWVDAVWALAVWVPLLASFLLLARRKVAAGLFGIGFVLILFSGIWNFMLADPPLHVVAGPAVLGFWAVILVFGLFQWLYARAMVQKGILA